MQVAVQVTDIGVPEEYAKTSVLVALGLVLLTTLWWCVSGEEESIGDSSDEDEPEPEPVKAKEPEKKEEKKKEEKKEEANPAADSGPNTRSKGKKK